MTQPSQVPYLDVRLILAAAALMIIGLVMITSASIDVAQMNNGNPFHYMLRHGVFIFIAICAGLFAFQLPMSWWQKSGWLFLAIAFFLLLIVLVPSVGKTVNGSTRWISLGSINIQPSELAKICLIAYLAGYLVRRREEVLESWWGFVKPMLVLSLASVLLLMEPDLGAVVVIGSTYIGMIFMSGAKVGRFLVLLALCAAMVAILIQLQPYRMDRLIGYTKPWEHQFDTGYQLTQSLIAFGRGEWIGVGLGNSIQKQFYLPEAHTDFVFAILAEEFGLLGSAILVLLFAYLVFRMLMIARLAERVGQHYASYFAYGIATLFAIQAFINMGVNMGLLPTKGLTLPLVSYGGSSLVTSCICLGILLRIHRDARLGVETTESGDSRDSESGMGGASYA